MRGVKSRRRSGTSGEVSLPDMAPLAGVMLLGVGFFLLGSFQNPTDAAISTKQLPASSCSYCRIDDNYRATINLNTKNQLAFSVTSTVIQAAVLEAVALHHNIQFTAPQLTALASMPFLRISVESLPAYLNSPINERNSVKQRYSFPSLGEKELLECVMAAKTSANTLANQPIHLSLRIEPAVKMSNVNHLIDLLQAQGINHFELATQFQQTKHL